MNEANKKRRCTQCKALLATYYEPSLTVESHVSLCFDCWHRVVKILEAAKAIYLAMPDFGK